MYIFPKEIEKNVKHQEAPQCIRFCLMLAPLIALGVRSGFSYKPAGAIHLKENSYTSEQDSDH